MNTKTIVIALIVIVLLAAGGYFAYTKLGMAPSDANPSTNEEVVQAQDVTVGTGAEATPGSVVSLLYVGRLADGTVFDSSEAHNNEPLRFQLGIPTIIPGFQIGVNGMREGGERRIAIPASLGYGSEDFINPATGAVVVPANSTLVFDVKLLKVEPAPTGTSTPDTL
jgi:peptidylprolyl isomerase